MNIGGRIVKRLNELNWERKDLLERVPDLTSQALFNLIKRDSVRSEWDERIAAALGVSVLWLVYGRDVEYSQKPSANHQTAAEPSPNVVCFPVKDLNHSAIEEVVRLMNATDELGRGMILAKVRDIAEERAAVSSKPKSSI